MKAFQNKTLTRWSLAFAAALVLASCGGSNKDTDAATGTSGAGPGTGTTTTGSNQPGTTNTASVALPSNAFASNLTGAEEVPPVAASATGTGVAVVDPSTMQMKATIVTAGITATAAHIHVAPRGQSGPIVFPLAETSGGSGIWTTQATLTTTQMNDLRAGNYYFNVHSAAFPNGEIRGQILQGASTGSTGTTGSGTTGTGTTGTGTTGTTTTGSGTTGAGATGTAGTTATGTVTGGGNAGTAGTGTVSTEARTSFINVLTGAQQVPANASAGVAIAVAIFDPTTRTLKSSITTMGISGTDAHIHQGAIGNPGPVIFPMTETTPGSGIWITNALLNDEGVSSLTAGTFYFDVHSAAYTDGELRAQIVPQAGSTGTGTTGTGTTGTGSTTGTTTTGTGTTGV